MTPATKSVNVQARRDELEQLVDDPKNNKYASVPAASITRRIPTR